MYTSSKWSRQSAGATSANGVSLYSYKDTVTDSLATIQADEFFDEVTNLRVADLIFIEGTDGRDIMYVASLVPTVLAEYNLTTVADGSITEAKLATEVTDLLPISKQIYTTMGGSATEDVTIMGVLDTDVVIATMHTTGATPRLLDTVITATDQVSLGFSDDPSTDHQVNIVVYRP